MLKLLAYTKPKLCSVVCTYVQNRQSPCTGLIHIHSIFRTIVQQSRTPAVQRRSSFLTKRGSCAKATVYLNCSAWAHAPQRHDTCTLSITHLRSSIKHKSNWAAHQHSIGGSVAQHRRSIYPSASDTYALASRQMVTMVKASAHQRRGTCLAATVNRLSCPSAPSMKQICLSTAVFGASGQH
jgi:hypothetical protein